MSGYRLRVRFQKAGRLRYLSHLETTRACERCARRAGMPYAVSEGFNPRMRVAFGPALPVGTAGLQEYYDLTLVEYVPADEALERLATSSAEELAPSRTGYVGERAPSLSAALTIAVYEAALSAEVEPRQLEGAMEAVTRAGTFVVERKGQTKVFDLTEALRHHLTDLLEADVEVFTGVSAAYKMPRKAPEEKAARSAAIQEALKAATQVPLDVAKACVDVLELCTQAAEQGNRGAVSDAGVAVLMAEAGLRSAALNVIININAIKDEAFSTKVQGELDALLEGRSALKEQVYDLVVEKL